MALILGLVLYALYWENSPVMLGSLYVNSPKHINYRVDWIACVVDMLGS